MPYTTDDFDYDAPSALIAQRPLPDRAASRLLVLDRATGRVSHRTFRDFPSLLEPGDALVVNASRVIKARLRGTRPHGGSAEVLLVHQEPEGTWLALVNPGSRLTPGRTIRVADDAALEIVEVVEGGLRRLKLRGTLTWADLVEREGSVPLPPYIRRDADAEDLTRYQTVYARTAGSVAAPTAGLHFTSQLLTRITDQGAHLAEVLLHVGPGTFKPVSVADPAAHAIHQEWYAVPEAAARVVNAARRARRRVWAVGTTVVRVLETAGAGGTLRPEAAWTRLFIRPPYAFHMVDGLLTNFHLPRSTLLMLVCAFGGYDQVMAAYRAAIDEGYRLYSYGDAMAIV